MQIKASLVAAIFAAVATGQDTSQIPSCALGCFVSSWIGSGCPSVLSFACLCANDAYIAAVRSCTVGACNEADQATTLAWAVATCASVGVPIEV